VCHTWLRLEDYGKPQSQGGWHVDHSKARARGGADHINNFYLACTLCNLKKGTKTAKSVRAANGKTRPPLSTTRRTKALENQAMHGAGLGALAGYLVDPTGILTAAGGILGAIIGRSKDPDE
jgi:hypothetical protein